MRALLLCALLFIATAAHAQETRTQLSSDIDASFPTTGAGAITAATTRSFLDRFLASLPLLADTNTFTGSIEYTATGGTTARSAQDRAADVTVNVMDFGAVCNGVTDDAASINVALNTARAATIGNNFKIAIVFPKGRPCAILSSLNFTGHHSSPFTAFARGGETRVYDALILCKVSGAPCIDALGADSISFYDTYVFGDATSVPTTGIQWGVSVVGTTAGKNALHNVTLSGHFSLAAFYNFGSEENFYDRLVIVQSHDAYAMILDGFNHFGVTSSFETQGNAADTAVSFNDAVFAGGSIQVVAAGATHPAIWVGGAGRYRFINTYSSTTYTGANSCNAVLYFLANDYYDNHQQAVWDVHFESTAVANAFCLDGGASATSPIIRGFHFGSEHASQVSNSIFKILGTSSITAVRVDNFDVSVVTSPQTAGAPQKLFDDASKWTITGKIYLSHSAMLPSAPSSWYATICFGDGATSSKCQQTTGIMGVGVPFLDSNISFKSNVQPGHLVAGSFTSAATGASLGPILRVERISSTAAANDLVGVLDFTGFNASSAIVEYGLIGGKIISTTAGSESGIMYLQTPIGGAMTTDAYIGNGVTIGSSALTTTTGALGLNKITASGSAPGAAGLKLEVVCGTGAGTAKLIAYAGTSSTATTVLDNIGSGVSGC